jgi:hypothetical protein
MMAWFNGHLYVGTGGRSQYPLGLSRDAFERLGLFANVLKDWDSTAGKKSVGARLWRYAPGEHHWEAVYTSPQVEDASGERHPSDRNFRAATVDGIPPALLVAATAMEGQVKLLRSADGRHFDALDHGGLGLPAGADIPSLRSLCRLGDFLYTSPVGKLHGRGMLDDNMSDAPVVLRSRDPLLGQWEVVSDPGLGDPDNLSLNEMIAFDGCLYAGTLNIRSGYQLWRGEPGAHGLRWRRILTNGAYRGPECSIAASMYVFRNHLFVGAGLQRQGRGGIDRAGPVPGELIRVGTGGEWDVVTGLPRLTPDGLRLPISGLDSCFGDVFNRGIWCMAEHDGWLYAGCGDWRAFRTLVPSTPLGLSARHIDMLRREVHTYSGGYSLWRSNDGENWQAVTTRGFGNPAQSYGIRTLTSSPHGLFVGTAATRGGFEVWQGNATGEPK